MFLSESQRVTISRQRIFRLVRIQLFELEFFPIYIYVLYEFFLIDEKY